jgi:PEP-CTERM motif
VYLALPSRSLLALAALLSLGGAPALAALPGPFNTGVDDTGAALADDAVDPHYSIVGSTVFGPAAYAKRTGGPISNGAWVDDSTASAWLVPATEYGFTDQPGLTDAITYRTSFDLGAYTAPGWRITGRWAADDSGLTIRLNGELVAGVPVAQADQWHSFEIGSGILPGLNTLEFSTFSTVSPTGLRVEMVTTPVPEPSTVVLWLAGAAGLAAWRRGSARQPASSGISA